jgi:hypothetical protein
MSKKYLAGVDEARNEMKELGISLSDGRAPLNAPLINSFLWEAWAAKLGAEGRHILNEYDQNE